MFIKSALTIFCICATAFIQSAAGDSFGTRSSSIASCCTNIIGTGCGNRGTHAVITTFESSDKPSCSVTLVYSEHPALQDPDTLRCVTAAIHHAVQQPSLFLDHEILQAACKVQTAHIPPPEIESLTSKQYVDIPMALAIKLSVYDLHYACTNPIHPTAGTYPLEGKAYAISSGLAPLPACETLLSPEELAEELQRGDPEKLFHLVINIAEWNKSVAPKPEPTESKPEKETQKQSFLQKLRKVFMA